MIAHQGLIESPKYGRVSRTFMGCCAWGALCWMFPQPGAASSTTISSATQAYLPPRQRSISSPLLALHSVTLVPMVRSSAHRRKENRTVAQPTRSFSTHSTPRMRFGSSSRTMCGMEHMWCSIAYHGCANACGTTDVLWLCALLFRRPTFNGALREQAVHSMGERVKASVRHMTITLADEVAIFRPHDAR